MRLQAASPLLHHSGLDRIVSIYMPRQTAKWRDICKLITHDMEYFRAMQEGDFGAAAGVNEATGVVYDDFRTPYNKDYYPLKRGIGFSVTTEAMETDQYGVIAKRAPKMFKSMNKSWETDAAGFINLATSTATADVGPDTVALASASHGLASGTASNVLTGNPPLSASALEQAVQAMAQQVSDKGDPMDFEGPFNLYVPPALWGLAHRIVDSNQLQGSMNNDKNWVGGYINKIVMSTRFTSTTAWALRNASEEDHGLAMIERRGPRMKQQDDIDHDLVKFTLTRIWVKAVLDWRGFAYSAGA